MDHVVLAYRCMAALLLVLTGLAGAEVWSTSWYPSPTNPIRTEWQTCGYMDLWSLGCVSCLNAALLTVFEHLAFRNMQVSPRLKCVLCIPVVWLLAGMAMLYHDGSVCRYAAPNVWRRAMGHLGSGVLGMLGGVMLCLAIVAYMRLCPRPDDGAEKTCEEKAGLRDSPSMGDVKVEDVA